MVDPLEAVITYLAGDPGLVALVGERIAAKHRYGDAWSTDPQAGESGLTVRLDGGDPDVYVPRHQVRLEVRCYAPSQAQAMAIWLRVLTLCRDWVERVSVPTSAGTALVYWLLPTSGPSLLFDDEVGWDFVMGFLEASVSEATV